MDLESLSETDAQEIIGNEKNEFHSRFWQNDRTVSDAVDAAFSRAHPGNVDLLGSFDSVVQQRLERAQQSIPTQQAGTELSTAEMEADRNAGKERVREILGMEPGEEFETQCGNALTWIQERFPTAKIFTG